MARKSSLRIKLSEKKWFFFSKSQIQDNPLKSLALFYHEVKIVFVLNASEQPRRNAMFKRLGKSRRHSADEVGCPVPPGAMGLDEASRHELLPRKSLEGQIQALNTALLRVSRNKYTRRSCGDAPTMQSLLASVDERSPASRRRSETDYQTVMAVPAFIVEHEPEKQLPPQRGNVTKIFFNLSCCAPLNYPEWKFCQNKTFYLPIIPR